MAIAATVVAAPIAKAATLIALFGSLPCVSIMLARNHPLTAVETKQLAYSVMTDSQKHRFEENLELDFSFGLKGLARFRANFLRQENGCGAVFRIIPETIVPLAELNLPKAIESLARGKNVPFLVFDWSDPAAAASG